MSDISKIIEHAFEQRAELNPSNADEKILSAVNEAVRGLNSGHYRVAEKINGQWHTHQWLKKAVLLYFRLHDNQLSEANYAQFFDKVPMKYVDKTPGEMRDMGVRIVPPAAVRYGAYVAPSTILMPSYTNIGAYIDTGCMIDTWSTVGSCAQIGKNVHLSGGVGIGGVLEPVQANPTIIEDHCFIGARSEIVEGVIVEEGSVISMGVFIGQSTKIYNRATGEILYGRVPAGSVVVPGNLPAKDGRHSLYAAIIIKQVDEKTRAKTSINELLRS